MRTELHCGLHAYLYFTLPGYKLLEMLEKKTKPFQNTANIIQPPDTAYDIVHLQHLLSVPFTLKMKKRTKQKVPDTYDDTYNYGKTGPTTS